MKARNTKKVLGTVIALGAATGAIVFGSFAAWTATTNNPGNSVTTGTVGFSDNDAGSAVITATNVVPSSGGATSNPITVTNDGLALSSSTLTIANDTVAAALAAANGLEIQVWEDPTGAAPNAQIFPGSGWSTVAALKATPQALNGWANAESRVYTVKYRLSPSTDDTTKSKTATFDLVWNGSL